MSLHPKVIDALVAAGVSLEAISAACWAQHEVDEEQRNNKRSRDAEHQRNRRARQKKETPPDLFERAVDDEQRYAEAAIADNQRSQRSQWSQPDKEIPPIPPKENTSSLCSEVKKDSGGGSAGARTTSDALDLADELGRMAGFEPKDCPPGWCGSSQTIQKFFNGGCPAEVIRTAVRAELKRLSGTPPPDRFGWFEKPIARAFANFQRSVPVVAVPKMEVISGGKENVGRRPWENGGGRSRTVGSATDAAAELQQYFARRAEEDERAATGMDRKPDQITDGSVSLG